MKGIFHSLVQLGLHADEFMNYANNALSKCLEKTSFITLSIFYIDTENQTIEYSRAGHCPALYFSKQTQESSYMQSKGLGLGIIRSKEYFKHIQRCELHYTTGDILVLYTDGIIEAHNKEGEEYGYDRLKSVVHLNHEASTKQMGDAIIADVYQFTETKFLADDYSFFIIRFI
jgi:phosphoserine phosphatase RsbU/P